MNENTFVYPQDVYRESGEEEDGGPLLRRRGGLTLRDYFARGAMTGMVGSAEWMRGVDSLAKREGVTPVRHLAAVAYDAADAMLAARKKRSESESE